MAATTGDDATPQVVVLGDVRVDGAELRAVETRLLVTLVAAAGRSLSAARLVELCWYTDDTADTSRLRTGLGRLRGSVRSVVLGRDGYRLVLPTDAVDAWQFERLLADAAQGVDRAANLAQALDLWPADQSIFGAVSNEVVDEAAVRLQMMREAALIELAALQNLTPPQLAALRHLHEDDPERADAAGAYADALRRLHRHAEAVTVIDRHHRALRARGLELSPELRRLENAVLTHDDDAERTMLPAPTTPFVGREVEVEAVSRALADCRHVSLVGPGGVGKTRLALRVASLAGGERVAHVQMSSVATDPAAHVATELGFNIGADGAERTLALQLRATTGLLVLDTCERAAAAVGRLVEHLLSACPTLHVVTTSRRPLGNVSETRLLVRPMSDDDAVALLRSRVPRRLDADDDLAAADLVSIVRRVDKLPLAVELAASQLGLAPIDDLLRSLTTPPSGEDGGLDDFSDDLNDDISRPSLVGVLQRSCDLLRPATRDVVPALSVASGPFDVESLAAIAGIDDASASRALADMADLSMVDVGLDGVARVLDTVRAFARVLAGDRVVELSDRHARHYSRLARRYADAQFTAGEEVSTVAILRSLDQLRAAFQHALDTGDLPLATDLTRSLHVFAVSHLVYDIVRWPEVVLERFDGVLDDELLEEQAGLASTGAFFRGDADGAARYVDIGFAAASRAGLPLSVHTANTRLALAHGAVAPPSDLVLDAVSAAARDPQPFWSVNISVVLALGSASMGMYDVAANLVSSAQKRGQGSPSPSMNAWLAYASGISALPDAPVQAAENFRTAENTARSVRAAWIGTMATTLSATALRLADRPVEAADAVAEALLRWTSTQFTAQVGYCLREAALQLASRGNDDVAREALATADSLRITLPALACDHAALDDLRQRLGVTGPHAPAPFERLVASTHRVAGSLGADVGVVNPLPFTGRRRRSDHR